MNSSNLRMLAKDYDMNLQDVKSIVEKNPIGYHDKLEEFISNRSKCDSPSNKIQKDLSIDVVEELKNWLSCCNGSEYDIEMSNTTLNYIKFLERLVEGSK